MQNLTTDSGYIVQNPEDNSTTLVYGRGQGFFENPYTLTATQSRAATAQAHGLYNPLNTPEYRTWDFDDAEVYNKPFPHLKGSDKVWSVCRECAGTGIYTLPTSHQDEKGRPYCFRCEGTGGKYIKVESARDGVREKVNNKKKRVEKDVKEKAAREAHEAAQKTREALEKEQQKIQDEKNKVLVLKAEESYPHGTKIDSLPITILRINEFYSDNPYAYEGPELTRVITFQDESGTQFTWFSASQSAFNLNEGDQGKLSATVKSVGTFRDQVQVNITRARVKGIVSPS